MPVRSKDKYWFKDAIMYELHIRAFFDSNGDGIGDFQGAIQKLDYLDDLGIKSIWLLPFYPSPLKDDGYDVTDYTDVHPDYGTLEDFKEFLKELHKRDMKLIIDLVLNHTSDQHPWFKKARKGQKKYRNYYVWSNSPEKFSDARVIFSQYENSNWTWDPEAKAYYWHRFFKHQPDLNYDNPDVRREILKVVDFWFDIGVDGYRVSSAPYLVEREGTDCENLPETHAFLKKLRRHIDRKYNDKILLAEANLWPEDAAEYFGNGDECHMNFHYPLMPRIFMALHTEENYPIIDILEQTPDAPEGCQWALFLRNHDEIALEMLTEEERDHLFKAYASDPNAATTLGIKRRLAPMMGNDRRKIELLYNLLFSLPGSPIIYYGDEIGMGDNIFLGDRAGVRTPMQWNLNINAGFSDVNPQKLYLPVIQDPVYRYEALNVELQQNNPNSLLWWVKSLIEQRKRLKAFGRGTIDFIESSNNKVLVFVRAYEDEHVIVISNLSRYSQFTTLNLENYLDYDITEIFSQNQFPKIESKEYPLIIGPYGYFWFQLEKVLGGEEKELKMELEVLEINCKWKNLFEDHSKLRKLVKQVFPGYLKGCRWFGGKAKTISKIAIYKHIPFKLHNGLVYLLILELSYREGSSENYFIPLSFIYLEDFQSEILYNPQSVICRIDLNEGSGYLVDSSYNKDFRDYVFYSMSKGKKFEQKEGILRFLSSKKNRIKIPLKEVKGEILNAEQSNTSIIYNDQYFLKLYRKLEEEINPDLEMTRFLSEKTKFKNAPQFAGGFEFKDNHNNSVIFGLLQNKVDNRGDAWSMTLDSLGRYFERVLSTISRVEIPPEKNPSWTLNYKDIPNPLQELIGNVFSTRVNKLGRRTAEMHAALASGIKDPAFTPEKFTPNYQRSVYSSLRKIWKERSGLLKSTIKSLPDKTRILGEKILKEEKLALDSFSRIYKTKINAVRTRIHGDYHLGQVLFTGKDFVIIDFEGEPGVSFAERRLKKSPLKDVAGMLRSFHYAAYGKILLSDHYRDKDRPFLEIWAEQWYYYVSRLFLKTYYDTLRGNDELTKDDKTLISTYLLEKAVYELGYELNSRPDWVIIPLRGIEYLLEDFRINR